MTHKKIAATQFDRSAVPLSRRLTHDHRWGRWALDAQRLCLCLIADGEESLDHQVYEIDLESITEPFWLLDWLCQIESKSWATPEVLGHLSRALIDLFRPRDSMKPTGVQIVPKAVLGRRIAAALPGGE